MGHRRAVQVSLTFYPNYFVASTSATLGNMIRALYNSQVRLPNVSGLFNRAILKYIILILLFSVVERF